MLMAIELFLRKRFSNADVSRFIGLGHTSENFDELIQLLVVSIIERRANVFGELPNGLIVLGSLDEIVKDVTQPVKVLLTCSRPQYEYALELIHDLQELFDGDQTSLLVFLKNGCSTVKIGEKITSEVSSFFLVLFQALIWLKKSTAETVGYNLFNQPHN